MTVCNEVYNGASVSLIAACDGNDQVDESSSLVVTKLVSDTDDNVIEKESVNADDDSYDSSSSVAVADCNRVVAIAMVNQSLS